MRSDLKLHRTAGLLLPFFFAGVVLITQHFGNWAGVLTGSVAVALAKEMIDPLIGGQKDWKDAAYTVAGTAAGMVALYLLGWK